MKAVATGKGKAWIVDLPVPRAQGDEVVIKLHASPICGSVMSGFFGDGEWINLGHEGAGEVVEVAHSTRLKVGDRVVTGVLNGCGHCPECLRGDAIFCKVRPRVHGTFAQFTRTADIVCTRISDSLSYAHASLMCCALGPAYEAIKRMLVRPYDTILVSGLGPVGLGAVALASTHGARVIAMDPILYRRDLGKKLGAAETLDPTDTRIQEILLGLTDGRGISRAIEASGNAAMERMVIDLADIRCEIAFVGENQGTIPLSPSKDMIRKGLTLHGCWHMNVLDSPDLIRFLQRWPAKADMLITHSYGFAGVQQAFDTFASKQCAKVQLLPWE
jgi:threonine dehydrogenase-like Zn-dependent dehydrogenase